MSRKSVAEAAAPGNDLRNYGGLSKGFSYVEKNAHVEEAIKRERLTEKRLARHDSETAREFNVNPYNRGAESL